VVGDHGTIGLEPSAAGGLEVVVSLRRSSLEPVRAGSQQPAPERQLSRASTT
jgi:hypothetical protein